MTITLTPEVRNVIAKGLLSPSSISRVEALKRIAVAKDASYMLKLMRLVETTRCRATHVAAMDAIFEIDAKAWLKAQVDFPFNALSPVTHITVGADGFAVA